MTSVNECIYDGETTFIGRKGSINKPFYYNGKFWTVDTLFYTHSFNKTTPKFVYCLFQTINWLRYNEASGVPSLSKDTIEKIKVFIPQLDEQRKISEMLSVIDERIATQNKIIEDLKKLKSAITNELIEKKIRFKGFSNDWKNTNLGNITINFNNRNKEGYSYPMYSVTNDKGFIPQSEQFEDREMTSSDLSSYKRINSGDIAYNPARINVGSIGRYNGTDACMISSLYVCVRPIQGIDSDWLMHVLKSDKYIYQYGLYGEGGVRIYLFYPNFSRIKIMVPTLEEQKKIATAITAVTNKLELEMSLLAAYQAQKRYLIQQLFI